MKLLKRGLMLVAVAILAGCAHSEYYAAMTAKVKADALVQVAKAEAETAKWDALARASEGSDVGRAVLGAVAAGDRAGRVDQAQTTTIAPPRDPIDTALAVIESVSRAGRVAVDLRDVKERNETARVVAREGTKQVEAREAGETARLKVVADAKNPDVTTVMVGGDFANNGSSISKPNCPTVGGQGGQAAPGGNPTQGNTTGGSSPTTPSATGGQSGQAGAGGAATGGCK